MRKKRNYERVGDENEDEDVALDDNQEAQDNTRLDKHHTTHNTQHNTGARQGTR